MSGVRSVESVRIFVADTDDWTELTDGDEPVVRISAPDLARARRIRAGVDGDVAVILDVTVAVGADFRSARRALQVATDDSNVRYVGTVLGLAGLIADIEAAGVADGVTLVAAAPGQDLRAVGVDVQRLLASRSQARAS
ncbi:uncharacterized protein RMCB_1718 [Mycolicibacterium brisbanense]|uniref:Uncharacterized protein n=1 Tax=Mycolicibacterium brisbanense TaxID=146020 RepID=A0A100VX41_9MYCO|nr:uncharacterized protein RMCB_1718 [Mycolicibacterium brisbanense]